MNKSPTPEITSKKSKTTRPEGTGGQLATKGKESLVDPKSINNLPDQLGNARLVGNFVSGSPEWHELRRTGIGGSDIAAICGVSPWTSPFALWAKKTTKIDETFSPSEAAEWGTRLEPVILDKFEQEHPELTLYRDVGTWAHQDHEWQLANPDGIYFDGEHYGILEIKTAQFEDDWTNGVPVHYATQVQWYLQTFGFKTAIVAVLFHGNKYREHLIEADSFQQDVNMQNVQRFRSYITTDTMPDFDGSTSTYETLREMHPDINPDAEVELGELGIQYIVETKALAEQEAKVNLIKSHILDTMGDAKRGLIEGAWAFTRQARNGGKPFLIQKKG